MRKPECEKKKIRRINKTVSFISLWLGLCEAGMFFVSLILYSDHDTAIFYLST